MEDPNKKPKDTDEKPKDTNEKPKDTDEKPKGTDEKPKGESEEGTAPDPFEGINARLASMEQAQSDMMKAISALANQGAVNKSIEADNDETDADEYPDIDLDSLNRLIGD